MELINRLLNGDKRACARLISMIENNSKQGIQAVKAIYKYTGKAHVVGITGPPGGGKSTLTDKLVKVLRKQGKKVGIIAIDPTSPFTGGSILGDRIRMQDLATDPDVFIRSMGTRGHLGGLSKATYGAIKILDAYGVDYIFVETVGVGQSEVDVVKVADTVVMVMVPGLGDDIQAIKAGIMEIGDIFVVNKSDLDGATRTASEIKMMLELSQSKDRRPPILQITAIKNEGIDHLMDEVLHHMNYLKETGLLQVRREKSAKTEIIKLAKEEVVQRIMDSNQSSESLDVLSRDVALRKMDPYTGKDKILDIIRK